MPGAIESGAGRTLRRLERRGRLTTVFVEQADHTFSRLQWRGELAAKIIERLESHGRVGDKGLA